MIPGVAEPAGRIEWFSVCSCVRTRGSPAEEGVDRPRCGSNLRRFLAAAIAQLVRALDCDSRGRGFESRWPPHLLPRNVSEVMFFVYILVCTKSGRSYLGHTDNLLRRFRKHLEGSTRTTRERFVSPYMVHWERFPTRAEAVRRERDFKSGSGHRVKHALIEASGVCP